MYKGSIRNTTELKQTLQRLKDKNIDIEKDYFDIYVMNFYYRYAIDIFLLEDYILKKYNQINKHSITSNNVSIKHAIISIYGYQTCIDIKNLIGLQWGY